jgi:outer membrane receptor protein involved in Fe transport
LSAAPFPRRAAALALIAAWPLAGLSQEADGLQTIIITPQKREQSAQQVGVAVTVLSGDELAARGVRKVNALQNEVPSLEIEPAFGGGQAQFRLRGVGFQDYATNNAGAVTVYVDEVALPLPVQTQGLLFDLDRVEVLRGPQGTLYGRNTTGGAVNFFTRKPTQRFEAAATFGIGSYGAYEGEGYVSGPLSDSLRGRLSVSTQQGGAWQRNRDTGQKLGDRDVSAARGQLEIDASRDLKVALAFNLGRDRSDGQGLYAFVTQPAVVAYPVAKPALLADTSRRATGWGFSPDFLAAFGLPANAKPSRDNDNSGFSATVNWDTGDLRLTSITAADRFSRKELADYDASALPLAETYFVSKSHTLSQELRLGTRSPDAAFGWLAGFYAADEKLTEQYNSSFANSFGAPVVKTHYQQKVRTVSAFGQVDWRFTRDLKLIAGLRQEHEQRRRDDFSTEVPAFGLVVGPSSGSFSNSQTSGKLALEAQLAPQTLVYGSLSRGVKSGGFTAYNTFNLTALTPFKPEVLIAYELGLKTEPTRQLRLNAALFHYDYTNQQILDAIKDPLTGATVGKIINAPKSTIDGIELEAAWRATPSFTLTQFLGYKDGHFREYVALSPPANLAGQALYFPRLSYGGGADYRFAVGGWSLLAHGDVSFHDKSRTLLNRINPAYDFAAPSYWLANARLEFAPSDAKWSATLSVRNLFNEHYDLTRNFFDLPLPVAAAGAPRTVSLQLHYDFF